MADEIKPVAPTIELLDGKDEQGQWIIAQVEEMIRKVHTKLEGAVFALAWKLNWSEDRQGNTPLGALKLVPELFWRLLEASGSPTWAIASIDESPHDTPDFVLLLNPKLWKVLLDKQKTYILDELLCYGSPRLDKEGEQATDEEGRLLWRTLKPQFSGFAGPIRRHGAQIKQIRTFLAEARRGHQEEIPFEEPIPGDRPGAPEPEAPPAIHYYPPAQVVDGAEMQFRFTGAENAPEQLNGVCPLTEENRAAATEGAVLDATKLPFNEETEVLGAYREFLEEAQAEKVAAAPRGLEEEDEVDAVEKEAAVGGNGAEHEVETAGEEQEGDGDGEEAVVSVPTRGRGGKKAAQAGVH